MRELFIILFSAILVDNFVLSKFLGIFSFLGVSKNLKNAMGIQIFLLNPMNLGFLQTLVFILVIAALVQMIEMVMKKSMPPLYNALGIYLPLITTNCAVLGVAILNITKSYTFTGSMINALGGGLGYMLSLVLFSGVRSKIDKADVPDTLKGLPITLIAASLVAVSFFGFRGLVENLFG
jgi:electron transport complex protein RnfA